MLLAVESLRADGLPRLGASPPRTRQPADGEDAADDQDWGQLLTLPDGLDWRTQPFSHVGGPGSQPIRVPFQRAA